MTDDEAVKAFTQLEPGFDVDDMRDGADKFVSQILRQHGFPKMASAYDEFRRACDA